MSVLVDTHPTLLDVTKRLDPKGNIDKIAEMLHLTNQIIDDAVFLEANGAMGHLGTVRTGLPVPTWRKLYGGVQPTKSRTAQVTDSIGMLEAYAEVDKKLADLNGNTAAFRMSEDSAHIEGMNQEFASTLIYGNEGTEPEAFTGLAPRYNSLSAANADNVISAGGASNCTSVWLVGWGPLGVHCIYPKGSKAGLEMNDKGQVTIENLNGDGGRLEAYRTHYKMEAGLVVRDWRYAVRIANIDHTALTKNAGSGADLIDLMTQAIELLPSQGNVRLAFYVNRKVRSFLRRQIANKVANSTLTMDTVAGKRVLAFDDIPVRRVDALLGNETAVA